MTTKKFANLLVGTLVAAGVKRIYGLAGDSLDGITDYPGSQVVSLSRDGGIAMLMGDILTLRKIQLPVKMIVFKNNALALVEMEMGATGFPAFATELQNPNFAKMAEAAGILGLTAETPGQVRPMIAQALMHDGPALVEVLVDRQELSAATLNTPDDKS